MAAIQSGARGGRSPIVGINVTPFVDITLVLLIIMMVSSTYIVSQTLKVELPQAATSDGSTPRTAVVTIDKTGALLFNDEKTELGQLRAILEKARATEDLSLVITADRLVEHGKVVEVIDQAKLAKITKFAINIDKRN